MENYEVVVSRTVRDLFQSTSLSQIRKYKLNKDKELLIKEDEIKKFILSKYPILIKLITNFEQISNHLNDLHEVKKVLARNIDNFNIYKSSCLTENEDVYIKNLFEFLEIFDSETEFNEEQLQGLYLN